MSASTANACGHSRTKRVALALDNGLDWFLWDLAALDAGLVYIPLPSFFSAAQHRAHARKRLRRQLHRQGR
ncbi:long-chain fatty acid--CoA ligase [Pseudomonas sp. MS19]|nr:long-chain fatty acid--CoA ligase [Pseudomonas sp. MS19]